MNPIIVAASICLPHLPIRRISENHCPPVNEAVITDDLFHHSLHWFFHYELGAIRQCNHSVGVAAIVSINSALICIGDPFSLVTFIIQKAPSSTKRRRGRRRERPATAPGPHSLPARLYRRLASICFQKTIASAREAPAASHLQQLVTLEFAWNPR